MIRNILIAATMLLILPSYALPKIAIIIDDLGNRPQLDQAAILLPGHVTLSIMPFRPFALTEDQLAQEQGKEVIVHVPMQAEDGFPMGAGGLSVSMSPAKVKAIALQDLNAFPYRDGFNNHMGSLFTQNRSLMSAVMQVAKKLHLFYIDSLTSPKSVGYQVAKQAGIWSLQRNVFLDDQQNLSYINHQFDLLLQEAKKNGYAIAIGHPYPTTLDYLESNLPYVHDWGVQLVFVNQL